MPVVRAVSREADWSGMGETAAQRDFLQVFCCEEE